MTRALLMLLMLLGTVGYAQAQSTVRGKVTSAEDGEGLPGVNVRVKGTTTGAVTDFEGNYTVSIPDGAETLVFSFVGFVSQEAAVGARSVIDIQLAVDVETLEEVVVIGYGVQRKKVATGSIAKIGTENIEGFNISNVQSALDGQVSGLIVNESSGQPGSGKSLLIRGVSTNGDNSPLYIVDGLQVSGIDNINPADVESVDVLKDAASSAIYGARAANGVVIITTKKGKEGEGSFSYEGFTSVSQPWKLPEMLSASDYVTLTREKFASAGQENVLDARGFPQIGATPENNTRWMEEIFDRATVQSHRVSATMNQTYLSLEYWDQNGVIGGDKSNYRRYSARFNSTKKVNDFLTLGENVYINRTENQGIGVNNAFGTVLADAFAYDPLTPVNDDAAQYGFAQSPWVQKEYINPLSRLFLADNTGHNDQIVGNIYAELEPIEGLRIRSDFGTDYSWNRFRSFVPSYDFHPAFQNPTNDVNQGYSNWSTIQWENYANYKKEFGVHDIDVVLGMSYRSSYGEWSGGTTSSIPDAVQFDDNWQFIDSGQDTTDLAYGGGSVDYRLISYYGRAIYNYADKYLFTATLRRDGSSNFGANNRWGIFPSFSAGWVLSDEPFFNVPVVSFLKLRSSWGVNGSDRIAALAFASTIENSFSYAFGQSPVLFTGAALATPPNPNIKWEESVQFDLGMELRLFKDQVSAEVDFYRKNTKDLLMTEVIPGYIGATNNPLSNLGEIQNTGIEAAVTYKWKVGDFNLNTTLNYTHFNNTVVAVAGDAGFINGWSWPVRNTPITRMTEGYPVGHFVGYTSLGVFASQEDVFRHLNDDGDLLQPNAQPGDLIFADVNGDGEITDDDIGHIGDPWPDHIFGLNLRADWKGFDFSAIVSTQLGHQIFRTYERSDIPFSNYQTFWLDRWTEENPNTDIPRLNNIDPNGNQRPSSFYVQDASFLRLRNLQVGYNLPANLLEKAFIKNLRVYASANNLLTVTGYQGFDPEVGTNGWILDTGIDKGYYPSNRTLGAGLRVTF